MTLFRKQINEVFTPRRGEVNPLMYMDREELEDELRQGLAGSQHILLHGESGCGKSWLYKRIFNQEGVFYAIANLANASRHKSITKELENVVKRFRKTRKTGYKETKSTEGGVVVAKASLEHESEYEVGDNEPLEQCFCELKSAAGRKKCVLVFENLETIFALPDLMLVRLLRIDGRRIE
jgi:hypothetical protein